MSIRYDAPEVTKLRGMLDTLREENARLKQENELMEAVVEAARNLGRCTRYCIMLAVASGRNTRRQIVPTVP